MLPELVDDRFSADGPVVVIGVRHHSPACAWHVARLIEQVRPDAVLVEGPVDANGPILVSLLEAETKPPVAIYAFRRGERNEPHRAFWYPFCDYSPEFVALAAGQRIGAEVAFCDLPSWWMGSLPRDRDFAVHSYGDHELRYHGFVEELCRRTGRREFDELWDHLFEVNAAVLDPRAFFQQVAAYGAIARAYSPTSGIEFDNNATREAFMAARIAERLDQGGRVVAVVGAMHRRGILRCLERRMAELAAPAKPRPSEFGCYLSAYGFVQLDRWSGYESGMPAPAFYQAEWESLCASHSTGRSSRKLLVDMGRNLRRKTENTAAPVSTADTVAADAMLQCLAALRGHRRPAREDLRDAIRSTWVKGAVDEGHAGVLAAVDRFLTGDRVGRTAPSAGLPPLVHDFREEVRRLRLEERRGTGAPSSKLRHVVLDIYRQPAHREKSAFLHRLAELDIPYAKFESGPEFVVGMDLDRVREIWSVSWRPEVEGALIERAAWGATVAEAAANHLLDRFRKRANRLGSAEAAALLVSALVMALPELSDELLAAAESSLEQEGKFAAAATALAGLINLLAYRPILGANRFPRIEAVAVTAYHRAVWLLDTLPGLPIGSADRPAEEALDGLGRVRHAVLTQALPALDAAQFYDGLAKVHARLERHPLLDGAATGLLRQCGRFDDTDVARRLDVALAGTAGDLPIGDFLRGFFAECRHAFIETDGMLRAVHRRLAAMPEDEFRRTLPGLRLAFTSFTPRETQRIGRAVLRMESPLGEEPPPSASAAAARIDALVSKTMVELFGARAVAADDQAPI